MKSTLIYPMSSEVGLVVPDSSPLASISGNVKATAINAGGVVTVTVRVIVPTAVEITVNEGDVLLTQPTGDRTMLEWLAGYFTVSNAALGMRLIGGNPGNGSGTLELEIGAEPSIVAASTATLGERTIRCWALTIAALR